MHVCMYMYIYIYIYYLKFHMLCINSSMYIRGGRAGRGRGLRRRPLDRRPRHGISRARTFVISFAARFF